MRYYTKNGDTGTTRAADGTMHAKSDPAIEAAGALDEAQTALGFAATYAKKTQAEESVHTRDICETLIWIQRLLFAPRDLPALLTQCEHLCDRSTPAETQTAFILPGGCELAARIELARVAMRRYERRLCALPQPPVELLPLINRLSDLLYALARTANHQTNTPETTP